MFGLFKRKETVSKAEHERIVRDLNHNREWWEKEAYRAREEANLNRHDAQKYRANIARLHEANARRKIAAANRKQPA